MHIVSHSPLAGWTPPPLEDIKALHDRYLQEVVEELNICPYARSSREQGRVLRRWLIGPLCHHDPRDLAQRLQDIKAEQPQSEIVLLSFVLPPDDPGHNLAPFEAWHRDLREAMAPQKIDRQWYSVVFHPRAGGNAKNPKDPAAFVQWLRRSPDPVIQCVCAQTLESVRQKAQATAQKRVFRDLEAKHPQMAWLAKSCVMTDSSLSEDIARSNFERLGSGERYQELMRRLSAIHRARAQLESPREA